MSDFTFAEHGEDILIHRLLLWRENGFYIDCGAYHPRLMSLTARLRAFGWSGINIDIDPDVVSVFDESSVFTQTKTIRAAIDGDVRITPFYRYEDPVLNTIDGDQRRHLNAIEESGGLFTRSLDVENITTKPLRAIIEDEAIQDHKIDFMNLDIEGRELPALEGFPWEKQQPAVISVEIHNLDLQDAASNPIVAFLLQRGYRLQSYVFHTGIFCRVEFDVELCHRKQFVTL